MIPAALALSALRQPAWDPALVAVASEGRVFVSWRAMPNEAKGSFVIRGAGRQTFRVKGSQAANLVIPGRAGDTIELVGPAGSVRTKALAEPHLSVPLRQIPGYSANDGSVGDLDGDGRLDLVIHRTGRGHDNSHEGMTDPPILEAYRLDGRFLWRINLGRNIREGAHYTQFLVQDFDGDGRCEVACKTADGSVDGIGAVIGDPLADHRNPQGRILKGPEFLTVFEGSTGRALDTVPYDPPRHPLTSHPTPDQLKEVWGDGYGNRSDRFLACAPYLDGVKPSLVFARGYYTRNVLAAWDLVQGRLKKRWAFDSAQHPDYSGQGNHGVSVGDVDGDGRDEIVYGSMTLDDDGKGLYSTKLGHGDALHLSDLDPVRHGQEVFAIHEKPRHGLAATFRDARTGEVLWSLKGADAGRGISLDIDPRHPGSECWTSLKSGLYSAKGVKISQRQPSAANFGIYWDGDLLREILDDTKITKWDYIGETEKNLLHASDCVGCNCTKATPVFSGDILGDWREEVIWASRDGKELRIYTTTLPTKHRVPWLMTDRQYRSALVWQNTGYNQPPHLSYWLGRHDIP